MGFSSRRKLRTAGALRLLAVATVLVAALAAGGAIAAEGGTPAADVTTDTTAQQLSLDDDDDDDDENPYERPDDGEGTIFEEHEVVTREDDDTAISGRDAERGEQTAVVETEDGVAVVVNDDEEVVTAQGDRVTTVSGTPINRFEVDDGGDLRTADEPFEELRADEDDRIVTASGEPVIDERGTELVANREILPYDVQFDVQFIDVVEPDEGEPIETTTAINNTGLADDTQQIELVFDGAVVDNETVSVEGETTETVELSHTTEDGDWGFDQDLLVRSEDDSDQTTINVSRGGLRVADSEWNAPVQAGETFETSITIERAGDLGPDRAVSYELVFEVDNDIQTRRIVTLDSGETTTETFEYETDADDPPTLPHQVTVGDRQFPAEPEVLEPVFTVEAENVTDDIVAGDSVRLNGTVRNDGMATDEQEIALQLNDSDADGGWRTVDSQLVELAPDTETAIEFFYRTSAATPSELDLRMASNATADGNSVSVEQTGDDLRVTEVEPDRTPVDGGDVVTFDATVENSGNETRTVSVTLERGLDILHDREIDVPADGTATATLPTQAPLDGGSYEYSAAIRGDAATTVLEVNETDGDAGDGDTGTETTTGNETGDDTDDSVDAAGTDEEEDSDEADEDGDETGAQADDQSETDEQAADDEAADETDDPDEDDEAADEDGLPWLTIGGAVVGVLVVVGVAVAATRTEELPIALPDAPGQLLQTAKASAATAAGTVAQQLPVDIGIGSTGQVTVANVTTDEIRFKIRCRTPDEVTLFEEQVLAASDTMDLDGLPDAGPVKIEINVKDGPRDDVEITASEPLSAAQVVVQAYDIDFTVE